MVVTLVSITLVGD